jgi:hypothetical protein
VSAEIVLGTIPWLVLAGLIEGFLTPAGLGLTLSTLIGITAGATFWSLLIWRGFLHRKEEGETVPPSLSRVASLVAGGERAADAEGEAQGEPPPAAPNATRVVW